MEQLEHVFFDDCGTGQFPPRPTKEELLAIVESPEFPLNKKFITSKENEGAIHTVKLKILKALNRYNHSMGCSRTGIGGYATDSCALVGESSTGKTHLAKLIAECVKLPFIEIQPKSVANTQEIFNKINEQLTKFGVHLVENNKKYFLPPCVVFIDEVHELSGQLKDAAGLLTAIEPTDAIMQTKDGLEIDCFNVCWMVATTEIGKLFHAFKTRMDIIQLYPLGSEEIAKIIQLDNYDWDMDICRLVAKYSRIPREAKRFASSLRTHHEFFPGTWEESAIKVAESKGIDSDGMHRRELELLQAISSGPIGKKNLPSMLQCQAEEVENDILPSLMRSCNNRPPLVRMTRKGVMITNDGKYELERRGLLV